MRFLSPVLGGLLLGAGLPALAQTAPDAPATPRFYVGLGAYSSYYQPLGHASAGSFDYNFRLPVQLTAGYQLCPRLAVQGGIAYSSAAYHYGQFFSITAPGQTPFYYDTDGTDTRKQTSVSALARYTLTANPAHRLQFDALGGFTLEHLYSRNQGTRIDNSQAAPTTRAYDFSLTRNTLLLTGGVGTRYRLNRHFELTYDFMVNKALNDNRTYGSSMANILTSSQALGLRYRFGR